MPGLEQADKLDFQITYGNPGTVIHLHLSLVLCLYFLFRRDVFLFLEEWESSKVNLALIDFCSKDNLSPVFCFLCDYLYKY